MVLYCLLSVPIFTLLVVSYKQTDGGETRQLWTQYARGLLVFVPTYILFLLVGGLVPLTYSYGGIFIYYFFYNAFYFSIIASLVYIVIQQLSRRPDKGSVSEAFAFLAGFFTFASVLEIIRHFPHYDSLVLFLLPTIRLAIIAALAFLLSKYLDSFGWIRWQYLVIGIVFVAATALVPFFYVIHLGIAAVAVTVLLFGLSLFPYALLSL